MASRRDSLPSPFGSLALPLSDADLRHTAYEIFVSACRTSAGSRPLTYTPQSQSHKEKDSSPSSASPSSSSPLQRSLTSAAASKMKKALGLKSKSGKALGLGLGDTPPKKEKHKAATVGELMRIQMGIPDQADARIRRGLLRIAAAQLGKRVESMVLPLELLQQFKSSDFPDPQEYDSWRSRHLHILQAGLLLHPSVPLDRSDPSAHRLTQILRSAADRPFETGRNTESMQLLRTAVLSLATRSFDRSPSDTCHWADGSPLNLYLYHKLLEACFDPDDASFIDELDQVLE